MPLSRIYGKLTDLRNHLYDRGVLHAFSLGARTISVGNITAGGTGKTPMVAYIAVLLAARGEKVCILTRGYGRKDAGRRELVSDFEDVLADPASAGDEPIELANRLLGKAIVIADADRVSAAEWARRKFGVTAFILDDGFQHRRARRDVDIVCIDATDPFGGGRTLPGGRLREPLANLARADVVVITRADLAGDVTNLRSEISKLSAGATIFEARNEIVSVTDLEEFHAKQPQPIRRAEDPWATPLKAISASETGGLNQIRFAAFCGLGNPENFFKQVRNETEGPGRFELSFTRAFPDHYVYSRSDIAALERTAKESGVTAFLTTAKDAVKLKRTDFSIPCYVVEIEVTLDEPEAFARLI